MILVGDIGGTKINLALFEIKKGKFNLISEQSFPSKKYPTFKYLLNEFLNEKSETVNAVCFGIAGPIKNNQVQTTNLPWRIIRSNLKQRFNTERVYLINDLQSNAYGIPILKPSEFYTLNPGQSQIGNRAIISAGTGLGEAIIFFDGNDFTPFPSEGGHTDFAPRNKLEIELLMYLLKKYHRVSYERILSGMGIQNIYSFLKETGKFNEPKWLKCQIIESKDPAKVISKNGLGKKSRICEKTLDMFVSIYGSEAGNLSLKSMAVSGIYIGGGIAPKILEKLKDGVFLDAFIDKGRLSHIVNDIPVKVILNPKTALIGAANYAIRQNQ